MSKKKTIKEDVVEEEKNHDIKKKPGQRIVGFILSVISIIVTILLVFNIIKLNIIPVKYFTLFVTVEVIGNLFLVLLLTRKRMVFFIIGVICLISSFSVNLLLNSYVEATNTLIEKTFTNYISITTDYVIITSNRNPVNSLEEVNKEQVLYYHKYSKNIEEALKEVKDYQLAETDSVSNTLELINNNPINYLIISKGNYDFVMESGFTFNKDNYKIIKEYSIITREKRNDEVKSSFTVYLNGVDFTGIMRDFNMLITVNMKTKKVLLTPILRGYYIDVPKYNIKDTLMCLGSLDSEVSKEALENLFQTKIDYTVSINTNSLTDVVDTLGGIEFCSDYTFTTTHALVKDTYYDYGKSKLTVQSGCRNYNGIEILTIARERVNLRNNERGRLDNCKKIMISIGKKFLSTTSIMNHKEVLLSFSNLYTTDMNKEVLSKLFKSIIDDYSNYQIEEQQIDGTDGTAIGHLGTVQVGVTFPDYDQVTKASERIKEVLK